MPIPADRLGVFLRHDDGREAPIEWSIYAGGLEGASRYYRIRYTHPGITVETFDATVDLNGTDATLCAALDAYRGRVNGWVASNTLSSSFLSALYALFAEDPWMSYSSLDAVD